MVRLLHINSPESRIRLYRWKVSIGQSLRRNESSQLLSHNMAQFKVESPWDKAKVNRRRATALLLIGDQNSVHNYEDNESLVIPQRIVVALAI